MLENNLKNATQQLENLYKLKTKKEIEENEVQYSNNCTDF